MTGRMLVSHQGTGAANTSNYRERWLLDWIWLVDSPPTHPKIDWKNRSILFDSDYCLVNGVGHDTNVSSSNRSGNPMDTLWLNSTFVRENGRIARDVLATAGLSSLVSPRNFFLHALGAFLWLAGSNQHSPCLCRPVHFGLYLQSIGWCDGGLDDSRLRFNLDKFPKSSWRLHVLPHFQLFRPQP